jgi:hypothetical protein
MIGKGMGGFTVGVPEGVPVSVLGLVRGPINKVFLAFHLYHKHQILLRRLGDAISYPVPHPLKSDW